MAKAKEILIPNGWRPRDYQRNIWRYLETGGKRAYALWHRRAGKDDVCLHWTAVSCLQRVGNYWHMLPEASQARKAIWDAINPHTQTRRIDEAFPLPMRKRTLENEMKIEFINGSVWQVIGSDNYNSYVGSPPVGVVFSEWALADPQAWAYTMPILEENNGWALFVTTPRGHNHAETFYNSAVSSPEWYCEKLTVKDTGIFEQETLDRIQSELRQQFGVDEGDAKFNQEYMCSFDALLVGAYYIREIQDLKKTQRLTRVPYDSKSPVYAVFDLGHGGSTAVIYAQVIGREPRIIAYDEWRGIGIDDTVRNLRATGYNFDTLILPHDGADGRTTATGNSYETHFRQAGFRVRILPRTPSVDADIAVARRFFQMVVIDEGKTKQLIESLSSYHRKWDDKKKTYGSAVHDWSSHGADAFRYAAVAFDTNVLKPNDIIANSRPKNKQMILAGNSAI